MAKWQDNFRSVRDQFQQASYHTPDLWYAMLSIYGDRLEEGVSPIEIVSSREPLAAKPACQVGPVRPSDMSEAADFLFGSPLARERFRALGNTAYSALLDSPRRSIADSVAPPRSPRERFSCWLDVLAQMAQRGLSPLLSLRSSTISQSLGDWTQRVDEEEETPVGFVHVNAAFLEQDVFTASAAAIDLLLGEEIGETPSAPSKIKRTKTMEARNKWIYEQVMKDVAYETIGRKLPKKNKAWDELTKQRVLQIARQYAKENRLDPPPPRQSGD